MVQKNFNGAAASTTLSSGIASGTTSVAVADGSTYPTANFNIVIDKGMAGEEKCFVTSRSGNSFTVGTRGYDGTAAAAHNSGATVQHCGAAVDFQDANDHIQATTGHGATGAVVGTTNTQTLSNKTLASPIIDVLLVPTAAAPAQTADGSMVWDSNDDLLTVGTGAARKTMVDENSAQILTNKELTTPLITAPTIQGGAYVTGTVNLTGDLLLPRTNSPAQTDDGSVVWDSDDNVLTVGDGAGRKTLVDTTSTQSLAAKTLDAASSLGGVTGTVLAAMPRGRVAGAQITSNATVGTSDAMVSGLACTFAFEAGRRYRAQAHFPLTNASATAGSGTVNLRWAAGGSVTTAGTALQVSAATYPATASYKIMHHVVVEFTCVASGATGNQVNAGSNTLGISADMPSASSTLSAGAAFPAQLFIEDIGVA